MTKREFLDTVFEIAPNEANKIMDAFDEYVESNVVPTGRSGKERGMSKYIIDIPDDVQYVLFNGKADNKYYTAVRPIAELEELNSDYINEHFGELQDEAYERGYEDGKNIIDKGCDGCKYTVRFADDEPCKSCSNCYKNKYEPMPKEDDRIEVGDIVDRYIDGKFDSRGIYLGGNGEIWDCLFWANTLPITLAYPKEQFKKTGKHYDIASILEAMRTHD